MSGSINGLLEKARRFIESGEKIVIFGWQPKNHDDFTLDLEAKELVRFVTLDKMPISAKPSDLWICTRFVGHRHQDQLTAAGATVHKIVYEINEIKDLLKELFFVEEVESEPTQKQSAGVSEKVSAIGIDDSRWSVVAVDYHKKAGDDPQASLTRYEVADILRSHFGVGPQSYASRYPHYFSPVEGAQRAGKYRATHALLEHITVPNQTEPTDPIERARWLVSRETTFRNLRDGLEKELNDKTALLFQEAERLKSEYGEKIDAAKRDINRAVEARKLIEQMRNL